MQGLSDAISTKQPNFTVKNEARFIAARLAKAGYYGGDPEKIMKAPIDIIISILDYERFEYDLSKAYEQIRKQEHENR